MASITNGASPQPDKACRRRLPIQGQAHAGTRGQVGRPLLLATLMNGDHDAKCVGARSGALSLRCGASDIKRYAARTGPRKSNLTQNSGFPGSSFLGPSCCTPSFDEAIASHHRDVIGELDRQLSGHRCTPRPSRDAPCRRVRDAADEGTPSTMDPSTPQRPHVGNRQPGRADGHGPLGQRADVGQRRPLGRSHRVGWQHSTMS